MHLDARGEIMVTYDEAFQLITQHIRVLDVEEKPLLQCVGQVLAEDIRAGINLPQNDIAGPDGYAVRSADIQGAGKNRPVTLQVIGTVRAGRLPVRVIRPGTAMRIMTGSVLPRGADCVVKFEDTDEPKNKSGPNRYQPREVKIYASALPGGSVRSAGNGYKKGDWLLPKGTVLGPAQVSVLASTGKRRIKVVRKPVVAIVATGDELVGLGRPLVPGRTYNANTVTLAALVRHFGGKPISLGIARDRKDDLLAKIEKGKKTDLIITTGGVAMGDYDLTRLVVGDMGKIHFSLIRMGPGAGAVFAELGKDSRTTGRVKVPLFGLAGPPSACLVNFETLVRPALLKMRGLAEVSHPVVEAVAVDALKSTIPVIFAKWTYLEQKNGQYQIKLNVLEEKGVWPALATTNSLTLVPEGANICEGDKVSVWPLDWRRDQFPPIYIDDIGTIEK